MSPRYAARMTSKIRTRWRTYWHWIPLAGVVVLTGVAVSIAAPRHDDTPTPLVPTVPTGAAAYVPVTTWSPSTSDTPIATVPAYTPMTTAPVAAPTDGAGGSGPGHFICADGTVSHAQHRQGACSHHGGVA